MSLTDFSNGAPLPMGYVLPAVDETLRSLPIVDFHTHLFAPSMRDLALYGPDELLCYHYLVAEMFRFRRDLEPDDFFRLDKAKQAELVWETLFITNPPASEAALGVVTVLKALGLDPNKVGLPEVREFYRDHTPLTMTNLVFKAANVAAVHMTNDPLDSVEQKYWQQGFDQDPRFLPVLRLDSALLNWPNPAAPLQALGYDVSAQPLRNKTMAEIRRYLGDWAEKLKARYMAISLPPSFAVKNTTYGLLENTAFPVARERNLPVALMIGVERQVNPALRLAGDGVGRFDLSTLARIAEENDSITFFVTLLSDQNQHELCVLARKFPNIVPFGCWWFLNVPSEIERITKLRLELLGMTFIAQHSDCRVLEQLLYKWEHSRRVLTDVLGAHYLHAMSCGVEVTKAKIQRDAKRLLGGGLIPGSN